MSGARLYFPLAALASIGIGLAVAWLFPIYFRADDAAYLAWAFAQPTPAAAFDPSGASLFGAFRPVTNLTWWLMAKAFGFNPTGYHVVLVATWSLGMATFARWLFELRGASFATACVLAWFATFHFLLYTLFWFSSVVYLLEILWMTISLLCFTRFVRAEHPRWLWAGAWLISSILAILTKEPAALLLPPIQAGILLDLRRRGTPAPTRLPALMAGLLAVAGLLWVFAKPGVLERQGIGQALADGTAWAFLTERWTFYASHLGNGPGLLLWIAAAWLACPGLPRLPRLALALSVAGAAFLWPAPLLIVLGLLILLPARDNPLATTGGVWLLLPIGALLTINFMVRTYLLEASFGGALLIGCALAPLSARAWTACLNGGLSWRIIGSTGMILAIGASFVGMQIKPLRSRWEALRTLSETRKFNGRLVEAISNGATDGLPLVVIDYEDRGLDYGRDVLPLNDLQKSRVQKTFISHELRIFLGIRPGTPIELLNFTQWKSKRSPRALVFAMNRDEIGWLESNVATPMERVLGYSGQWSATGLYRVGNP